MGQQNECFHVVLGALSRQVSRKCESIYVEHDIPLSIPHGCCLKAIIDRPGRCLKDLGESMFLANSTITRFVASLEDKGYLYRQPDPYDGRSVHIYPTNKAKRIAGRLTEAQAKIESHWVNQFSESQRLCVCNMFAELNG